MYWTAFPALTLFIEDLASAVSDLSPSPKRLRIPDLLFCEHEGAEETLSHRRRRLWDLFLKRMTCNLCVQRPLSSERSTCCSHTEQGSTIVGELSAPS